MRTNILKYVTLSAFALLATASSYGQNKHEISVYGGGGLSSLDYKIRNINDDDVKHKFGGHIGLGYTYFLNNNWGINTGAEIAFYKAEADMFSIVDKYMTQDDYNDDFEFRVLQRNYKETQKAMYVNIPIMAQYQAGGQRGFYAAAGAKVGIPLSGKYESTSTSLKTSGYYPSLNVEYDDLEYRGFGEFGGPSTKDDVDFKVSVMLSAEAGVKWELGNSLFLYTGLYADYGLNDIVKDSKNKEFLAYNNDAPTNFVNNSILNSKYSNYNTSESFVDKVRPFAVGLKFRLAFGQ